jgi:hypothetical protein
MEKSLQSLIAQAMGRSDSEVEKRARVIEEAIGDLRSNASIAASLEIPIQEVEAVRRTLRARDCAQSAATRWFEEPPTRQEPTFDVFELDLLQGILSMHGDLSMWQLAEIAQRCFGKTVSGKCSGCVAAP